MRVKPRVLSQALWSTNVNKTTKTTNNNKISWRTVFWVDHLPRPLSWSAFFLLAWLKLMSPEKRNLNWENAAIGLHCGQVCRAFSSFDWRGTFPSRVAQSRQKVPPWAGGSDSLSKKRAVSSIPPWLLLQLLPWLSSMMTVIGKCEPNKPFPPRVSFCQSVLSHQQEPKTA